MCACWLYGAVALRASDTTLWSRRSGAGRRWWWTCSEAVGTSRADFRGSCGAHTGAVALQRHQRHFRRYQALHCWTLFLGTGVQDQHHFLRAHTHHASLSAEAIRPCTLPIPMLVLHLEYMCADCDDDGFYTSAFSCGCTDRLPLNPMQIQNCSRDSLRLASIFSALTK